MTNEERPYIDHCSFCNDGLLRFYRCTSCDHIIALCDECELMWEDIAGLSENNQLPSDTAFPQCPSCGYEDAEFARASMEEIEENRLDQFSAGESV